MKLIIDIPDSDYTAVRCEALYYIGHDELAKSVTTAFQAAIPYEARPQGEWIIRGRKLECSNCKRSEYIGTDDVGIMEEEMKLRKYCFNCGADMKGGAGNEKVGM